MTSTFLEIFDSRLLRLFGCHSTHLYQSDTYNMPPPPQTTAGGSTFDKSKCSLATDTWDMALVVTRVDQNSEDGSYDGK